MKIAHGISRRTAPNPASAGTRCAAILLATATLIVACGDAVPPAEPGDGDLPPLTQFTFHEQTERDAAWSPDGQWISFGSFRSGNEDIWKKRADGTGEAVQITTAPSNEIYAVWSPDGERLAFTSDFGDAVNVWTIAADGGEMTRVTSDADSVSWSDAGGSIVSWSPDGQWLAFVSDKGGNPDVVAVSTDGARRRRIAGGPADDRHPAWSPDGQWIAFSSDRGGNTDLWVARASGGSPRQLTTDPAEDGAPSWSPDGRWIAFQSDRSGYNHIYLIPFAGGTAVPVTGRPQVHDFVPRWSPDGTRISFNSQPTGGALWTVPIQGGETRSVVSATTVGLGAWSADGTRIAFVSAEVTAPGGKRDIHTVSPAGDDLAPITRGGIVDRIYWSFPGLDWSPDGEEIVFVRGDQTSDLWAVSADGGEPWQLTVSPGNEAFPRYSPDGTRIAYTANEAAGSLAWDIWTIPRTGGIPERVVDWASAEYASVWSPDGERLAFVSNRDTTGNVGATWHVWTVSASGSEPQWLAEGTLPDWSPDGSQIVYVRQVGSLGTGDLWKVSATGGTPEPLLEGGTPRGSPRWSPDGSQILFSRGSGELANIWVADVTGLTVGH